MESPSSSLSDDDDPLPLSALQHWLFCPRQCALIHVERLWEENALTMEGRILHEAADAGRTEKRGGVTILRALPLRSRRLEAAGVADVVEIHAGGAPFPVEYKRGRPKAHRADEVQLCAQAICLEEMFGRAIPEGALFYGEARRRQSVAFDADLRRLTEETASAARAALRAGRVPAPVYASARCDSCSLLDLCRPKSLERPPSVEGWLRRMIAREP